LTRKAGIEVQAVKVSGFEIKTGSNYWRCLNPNSLKVFGTAFAELELNKWKIPFETNLARTMLPLKDQNHSMLNLPVGKEGFIFSRGKNNGY
jgi:hypothetical protein